MLGRLDVDVAIYRDRVQVTERKSGLFVDQRADHPFSSDERLVADATRFDHALSHALRQVLKSGGFMLYEPRAVIGPTDPPLTAPERDLVRRVLKDSGFRTVEFDEGRAGI
ncbi:MAG: hypothetical protein MK010_03020 [Erythrobacter sp.]|nr:hypothetical protein [Erythrobacter sp.]